MARRVLLALVVCALVAGPVLGAGAFRTDERTDHLDLVEHPRQASVATVPAGRIGLPSHARLRTWLPRRLDVASHAPDPCARVDVVPVAPSSRSVVTRLRLAREADDPPLLARSSFAPRS